MGGYNHLDEANGKIIVPKIN